MSTLDGRTLRYSGVDLFLDDALAKIRELTSETNHEKLARLLRDAGINSSSIMWGTNRYILLHYLDLDHLKDYQKGMRSTIMRIEKTGEVHLHACPFTKFYGLEETQDAKHQFDICQEHLSDCRISPKLDGSIIIAWKTIEGKLMLSTSNCIDAYKAQTANSESYWELFERVLKKEYGITLVKFGEAVKLGYTYWFELYGADNIVVCRYKKNGITTLGIRDEQMREYSPVHHGKIWPTLWENYDNVSTLPYLPEFSDASIDDYVEATKARLDLLGDKNSADPLEGIVVSCPVSTGENTWIIYKYKVKCSAYRQLHNAVMDRRNPRAIFLTLCEKGSRKQDDISAHPLFPLFADGLALFLIEVQAQLLELKDVTPKEFMTKFSHKKVSSRDMISAWRQLYKKSETSLLRTDQFCANVLDKLCWDENRANDIMS